MDFHLFTLPALIIIIFSTVLILISRIWRWVLIGLAIQYIGVFILTALDWSIEMATGKLVAGWIACTVLGIAMVEALSSSTDSWKEAEHFSPSGSIFRLLTAILVGLVVFSLAPKIVSWIPGISMAQVLGGFILIGMGVIHLGFTIQPLRVVCGLLSVLSGFEILYAAIESSILVAGLLAAITLGLALVGAYLVVSPTMEGPN